MSTFLKQYNQCLFEQTELLISGFISNLVVADISSNRKQMIISLMCEMHGLILSFNESNILTYSDKLNLQKLIASSLHSRNISFKSTKLIFDATKHGFTHQSFYKYCSGYENTLIIIASDPNPHDSNSETSCYSSDSFDGIANNVKEPNKIIFGAFTCKQWKIDNCHVKDNNAFLYRLRANKYGPTVFRLKEHEQFALFQPAPPEDYESESDIEDDTEAIFYFGQPVTLLISENCDDNFDSYCCGGEQSNYDILYSGSILGFMHSPNFRVMNLEVFHIVQ